MREVLFLMAVIGAPVVYWGFRHGGETGLMVTVATCSVLFFSTLPVVLGAVTRKKRVEADARERVVVRDEAP
jgi:hypothetical protein